MLINSNSKVIAYINELAGYRGYVQFSHRALGQKDIFEECDPKVSNEEKGFVYEAHFCNEKESIMIRQQNDHWMVSRTDIANVDSEDMELFAFEKTSHLEDVKSNWVKMAQIWEPEPDALCEGMDVLQLKRVVFAGFAKKKED